MCTIQGIKDAIRENYQSQYDMESADIDRLLQSLPFYQDEDPFDRQPPPRPGWIAQCAANHSRQARRDRRRLACPCADRRSCSSDCSIRSTENAPGSESAS